MKVASAYEGLPKLEIALRYTFIPVVIASFLSVSEYPSLIRLNMILSSHDVDL